MTFLNVKLSIKLFIALFLISTSCFAAIKSKDKNLENEKLIEELTGRTVSKSARPATLPARHLSAGLDAFKSKNYILSLKHFNTVILKYSKSAEVKLAYLAKSKLYREMGLLAQAELNSKLALQYGHKISK